MTIANRLRLLAPGIVLLTALLVGLVVAWGYRTLVDEERSRGLVARTDADGNRVSLALQQIQDDMRFLVDLPKIAEFVEDSQARDSAGIAATASQLSDIFASMLRNRPHYDQVRLIGAANDGLELIRVERNDAMIARVVEENLQNKGHRDYVRDTLALSCNEIFVSKISLNREQGRLEVPYHPAFRIAAPVCASGGEMFGLVIINLNFTAFIQTLLQTEGSNFEYFISNADGGYVIHPDPAKAFGFEFGEDITLQGDYPELAALFDPNTGSAAASAIKASDGKQLVLIHARRLYPFYDDPTRFIVLALATSASSMATSSRYVAMQVVLLILVLLAIASAMAFLVARRLTQPLKQLTESTDQVTNNDEVTFPFKDRDDEIGTLSRALDHMVTSLRQKEDSLRESVRDLEFFSRIASHDLTEPARRIAALANLVEMEQSQQLSDEGGEMLDRLRRESLSMIQQLTDMRAFSRIGSSDPLREEVDLKVLVKGVLANRKDEIDQRGIMVRIDPLPRMPIYKTIVEMLYHNLVDNALQHSTLESFELTIGCEEQGGQKIFSVANTGSSLAVEPETLFDAFYTGSKDSGRSGLGLSICRHIVERHSGHIWVDLAADRIVFSFTLTGAGT